MPNYNSYYPASYQNPYQGGYGYNQPMQMPQQQPIVPGTQMSFANQPLQATQNSIIWVSGDKEASMYPIAPNNAVTLWSQSEPVVYLKQADASGKPTMKIYDLVERSEAKISESGKTDEYVTKTDFSAVVNVVNGYKDIITTLTKDLETVKGDLYGIAGKKKTVSKKQEEDADE